MLNSEYYIQDNSDIEETKLEAAKMCTKAGIPMVIVNGKNPSILYDVLEGDYHGTFFDAKKEK